MDEADFAYESEAFHLQEALRRVALAKPAHPAECRWCEDCGIEIPKGRRIAVPGATKCVACQTGAERISACQK